MDVGAGKAYLQYTMGHQSVNKMLIVLYAFDLYNQEKIINLTNGIYFVITLKPCHMLLT